jgi:hypothetical protein
VSEKYRLRKEKLMEELGSALTSIGKSLTDLKKKKIDKPIPDSFLRSSSSCLFSLLLYITLLVNRIKEKFSFFFLLNLLLQKLKESS